MQPETKTCRSCKVSFVIDASDFGFYEKMGVPAPALCPVCRFRRRSVFRNERTLYKRICGLCNRSIISMYHPKSPYVVYCNDCWISDKWDPFSYGMAYDPGRPFFEQLDELVLKVPKSTTSASYAMGPNINSEYTNFAGSNKDCYLIMNSGPNNENCAYSRGLMNCRDSFDAYYGEKAERTYEGVNVEKCSGVVWVDNAVECVDSWFLLNCSGCTNCFGCVNLRHKSYHFFNEPLDKEEWRKRVSEIAGSYSKIEEMKKRFAEYSLKFPCKENTNFKSIASTGNYVFESKNTRDSFEALQCEDVRYAFWTKYLKDSYDVLGHGRTSELLLECVAVGAGSSRIIGGWWVESSHDVEYSFATRSSAYCFGCDTVKGAEYVILNKKYSPEEYKKIREHIVNELKQKELYGGFFPAELGFFGYNEGVGQDNVPLSRDEALRLGFRWQDDIPVTKGQETIQSENIPDHIKDVQDSILNEILRCIACGRNYRLIRAEIEIYRRMLIPVPRECFNCRHEARIRRRGPITLFNRTCAKCGMAIKTNFAPNRPEIVYCETCYQAEVV